MKRQFTFAAILIAMVVLALIPVSLVNAIEKGLNHISGSDCDTTTFEYQGHTIAEGFAAGISADLPLIGGRITKIKFGCAVAGLGDTWDSTDGMNYYFKYTPYVNEMRVKVEGKPPYTADEWSIYDSTGTGGSSVETFSLILGWIGDIFTTKDIYDWLAQIYQLPPVAEWRADGHWSQAIVRQQKEFSGSQWVVNPSKRRVQTATAEILSYFEEGCSRVLNVTAEAEIYLQIWDLWSGAIGQVYIGTYSVSFEVDLGPRTLSISASTGGTTDPYPGIYTYEYYSSVAVTASAYSGYTFNYWLLDGATVYDTAITVTMDSDHTLTAYFNRVDDFFDGDFLEGWSCSGGDLYTDGDIGSLMIFPGYSSAVMTKSLRFHSAVLEFVTVSCTCLPIDCWRFEARRASDGMWFHSSNVSSAETKTWVITDWYTGEIDKVGIRVFGEWGYGVGFDFVAITRAVTLTINSGSGGTTNPPPGTYEYLEKTSVEVTAIPDTAYYFKYWVLDGQVVGYGNTITVTTDAHHTLTAYFRGGGGCPTLFVWNGNGYVDYGVINIHNPTGEDVIREVPIQSEDVCINSHKAKFRLREGWEGLNFSESVTDQVKLYAVDSQGNRHLCPLISAEHSRLGNVLLRLLLSDDYRAQMLLLETVDLTFIVPWQNIQGFTFAIEGCNFSKW